jgi:ketosteroid isomerase-like protein
MNRLLAIAFCSLALLAAIPEDQAKSEVSATMEAWKRAVIERDRAALDQLYAPDLVYSHSNAHAETKAEAIDSVVNGPSRFEAIDLADVSIRVYGNTAVVRAKVTMHLNNRGQLSAVPLSVLHVWVKNPAGWQLVARQSTHLGP